MCNRTEMEPNSNKKRTYEKGKKMKDVDGEKRLVMMKLENDTLKGKSKLNHILCGMARSLAAVSAAAFLLVGMSACDTEESFVEIADSTPMNIVDEEIGLIPPMYSNTLPSGTVDFSDQYVNASYQMYAWHAFDRSPKGNRASRWMGKLKNGSAWISYEFPSPVKLSGYYIQAEWGSLNREPRDFKLQAWDGKNWKELHSRTGETEWESEGHVYDFNAEKPAYRLYRLMVTKTTGSSYVSIRSLQLYGEDSSDLYTALIPEMTSNTTPSGEVTAKGTFRDWEPWKAMDGPVENDNSIWAGYIYREDAWLAYEFPGQMIVNRYFIETNSQTLDGPKKWQLQGSNNGVDWWLLDSREFQLGDGTSSASFEIGNIIPYSHYKLVFPKDEASDAGSVVRVKSFQLYGTDEIRPDGGAISEMTSNNTPTGNAYGNPNDFEIDGKSMSPWKAFDGDNDDPDSLWACTFDEGQCELGYQFPSKVKAYQYYIEPSTMEFEGWDPWWTTETPKKLILKGSNNGKNWVTVDERELDSPIPEKGIVFEVSKPGTYLRYKLVFVNDIDAENAVGIRSFQLYQYKNQSVISI